LWRGDAEKTGAFHDIWKDAIYLRAKTEALWQANLRKWRK
jgi:hypothetical protein